MCFVECSRASSPSMESKTQNARVLYTLPHLIASRETNTRFKSGLDRQCEVQTGGTIITHGILPSGVRSQNDSNDTDMRIRKVPTRQRETPAPHISPFGNDCDTLRISAFGDVYGPGINPLSVGSWMQRSASSYPDSLGLLGIENSEAVAAAYNLLMTEEKLESVRHTEGV